MPKLQSTPQTLLLANALKARGVELELEYWDGYKHVDIFIPKARIALEIDGLPHFLDAKKIDADFHRDFYSNKDAVFTKRIPNEIIETHLNELADAIAEVVKIEVKIKK